MLPGIVVKPLKRFADERGLFSEIIRSDWIEDEIVQANCSITYPNIIRAWHKHEQGQVDYFIVIKGALKICIFDDNTRELNEIISTGDNMQIVRVPGHYWHGFKVIGNEKAMLIYFVNKLYNYEKPDEIRRIWNDSKIIPLEINGKKDDPRCNQSWDWHYAANK